jgi:hypothetical protein
MGTRPGFSKGAVTRRKSRGGAITPYGGKMSGGGVAGQGKFTGLHPVTNKAQATNWSNFLGKGTLSQKASHGAARQPKFESPLAAAVARRRRGMRSSVKSLRHH